MSEEQDDSQKTEEPSQKRLEEARKKGQVVNSREINSFFVLLTFGVLLTVLAPPLLRDISNTLTPFITRPEQFATDLSSLRLLTAHLGREIGATLAVPVLLAIVAALGASGLQTRFNMSWEPIIPKLEKISPMKGLARLFSRRNLVEFLKGILKITLVGTVAFLAVRPHFDRIPLLPDQDMHDILLFLATLTERMVIGILIVLFLLAAADYTYQYFAYMKNLRMSKQELKDEYKQQEGDPHIKQKLKQIRAQRARGRMMANVPKADVVITNPTHYAVALRYEPATMKAPILIAKGADTAAFRIREVAQEHKIPVIRNPPLARTLYDTVELDMAVPTEHYRAVAQIISYVFRLKGRTLAPHTAAGGTLNPGKAKKQSTSPTPSSPMKPMKPKKKKGS